MLKPNANVAAMAAYALPDITTAGPGATIVLAQNEHPLPPCPAAVAAAESAMHRAQLYADSECTALRRSIGEVHGLDPDHIVCGAGSMELMSGLLQAYVTATDRVLMSDHGYLYMRTLARLAGAPVDAVAEPDYRVDIDGMIAAVRAETKLVFVVNPGNPCGTLVHNDEIRRLRESLDDDVILLVDEAYAEFVDGGFHPPLFDLALSTNTVITRTFSKIYGLAGLRVGWGYFPAAIRDQIRKVLNPGSVTTVSQAAATAAIGDRESVRNALHLITVEREFLTRELTRLGYRVIPSHTNFVLVDFGTAETASVIFELLRKNRLVVRPMSGYGLPHCLRITISLAEHMHALLEVLETGHSP